MYDLKEEYLLWEVHTSELVGYSYVHDVQSVREQVIKGEACSSGKLRKDKIMTISIEHSHCDCI